MANESPIRKKRRRKKKKKKKPPSAFATFVGSIRDFYSEYELLIKPLGIAAVVAIGAFVALVVLNGGSTGGRDYIEFGNRTTPKWLEMEREGTARRAEVLWRDQRWMPLQQFLGLDWEALPEILEALADSRTQDLAESILKKYSSASGQPRSSDVLAGLQMENDIQVLWAARCASRVTSGTGPVVSALEELTSSSNAEIQEAAKTSLERINSAGSS